MTNLRKNGLLIFGHLVPALIAAMLIIAIFSYHPSHLIGTAYATNTGVTTVSSSANVQIYCAPVGFGANTIINFGAINPGANTFSAPNAVVANNIGNVGGWIYVMGQSWANTVASSNGNFFVSNTAWNKQTSGIGPANTALNYYNGIVPNANAANTAIYLPLPASGTITANNIYFGVTVPAGQPAGLYVANIVFQLVTSTATCYQGSTTGNSLTSNVQAFLTVQRNCFVSLSNVIISFGAQTPGSTSAYNNIFDTNPNGNAAANIITEGSNWIYAANTINVANTAWSPTGVGAGTSLQYGDVNTAWNGVDTLIQIPYSYPTVVNQGNSIYYDVSIPPAQTPGLYSANILIENSC